MSWQLNATGALGQLVPMACDLATSAGIANLSESLAGPIDLVIHSAGTSAVGPFVTQPSAAFENVLAVNLYAPIALTTRLVGAGHLSQHARIVLVSSLSHYLGYPGAAVYAASKDGLASYGRSLSIALGARGGHCLSVFPGPMLTPHAARFAPPGASERGRIPPEVVARALLSALAAGKSRLVVGVPSRLARLLGTFAPNTATRIMAATLWRKLR
jgi:short-subunit dehydrogenase